MIKSWQMFLESSSHDEEVATICDKYAIIYWSIDPDTGLVDVEGDVDLSHRALTKIPLNFGKITGSFNCQFNKLITLEGSPYEVGDNFYCNVNNLDSLKGSPSVIIGNFSCASNNLTTLEGSPKEVGLNFYCNDNKLTSLEGVPSKVFAMFNCDNNRIISLEGLPNSLVFSGYHNMINNLTEIGRIMNTNKISFIESVMLNITKITNEELTMIMKTIDAQKILDLNDFKIFNLLRTQSPEKYAEVCALRDVDISADLGELGF